MKTVKLKKLLKSSAPKIILGAILLITAIILEQFDLALPSIIVYALALLVSGIDVFVDSIRGIMRRDIFDEKLLMSIASIGAMIIGEYTEAVAVMLFFLVGESFERLAVSKSRQSIRSLMDICPDEACVLTDDGEETVDAEDVEVGSIIVIRPGERVPIDCVVVSGSADVDTSSMTGEPLPISAIDGSVLDSGYVVLSGLLKCRTTRAAGESAAARVLELVENASDNKSKEEKFITKFSRYYTPCVVISALLLALLPPLFGFAQPSESIYRALIFLVISCPCALVISVPMAFFGGIGGAASRGILYKGGNVFSSVARADTVAFDKTGTVTSGEFSISEVITYGEERARVLSLAASAEYASNHPIAKCIRAAVDYFDTPSSAEEIAGEGIVAMIDGVTVGVGNAALMARLGVNMDTEYPTGVYVCADSSLIGIIRISDSVKPEAAEAISELRNIGITKTAILSGDKRDNVLRVAAKLGIDEAEYELSPEQKYNSLERLIFNSRSTIYVGDGINDAPSLARADVGISMGRMGQDSAIEASDVVIMTDNLFKVKEAILIARKTLAIAKQNIVFALGVKGAMLVLGALGFANMWLAVFADVGVAVLAILNSMRALRYSERK